MKREALIFSAVCGASAFIGWVAGYDFNERAPYVALWAGLTLLIAAYSAFSYALLKKK